MVLKYEDLTDVILVGHSYGGMIIAAVAEQAAERISHLVSLDGYIPENGQSIADIAGAGATRVFEDNARSHGDGWLLIHPLVLRSGRRLFADDGLVAKLRLVNSVATASGVVVTTYLPAEP